MRLGNEIAGAPALALIATLSYQLSTGSCSAQGSLTPPGAPGPVMKTLSQIEPRTPISSAPFTVSAPGSYYLTTNLSTVSVNGITVAANDVTIDLNGFALVGNGGATGIITTGSISNLYVYNGTIRNWTFSVATVNASNSRFEKLQLSASTVGIETGINCVVADCAFWNAGNPSNPSLYLVGDGCLVRNCIFGGPSLFGVQGGNGELIESCVFRTNMLGIYVGTNCTIRNCNVTQSGGTGITASDGATVVGCQCQGNSGAGIVVGNGSVVEDCLVRANTSTGIAGGSWVTFRHCTALNNSGNGIQGSLSCTFDGCQSVSNTSVGIDGSDNSTAQGCSSQGNNLQGFVLGNYCQLRNSQANQNSYFGIQVSTHSQIADCQCVGNTASGIIVQTGCTVTGSLCSSNGFSGISVFGSGSQFVNNTCNYNDSRDSTLDAGIYLNNGNNLVDGNHLNLNDTWGLAVFSGITGNVIIRNNAIGNPSGNYSIPAGNDAGPIGTAAAVTSPWANISN